MFNIGGRQFAHIADHGLAAIMPFTAIKVVTPSATPFTDGPCRGVWASEDLTIDFVDTAGNEIAAFPLAKGRNDICAAAISAVSTGTVWAAY